MNSDRLIAELAEHLHRHGVKHRPAELDAFASGLLEAPCDLDAATLTQRFLQAQRAHVLRERMADYACTMVALGGVLLLIGLQDFLSDLFWNTRSEVALPTYDLMITVASIGLGLLIIGAVLLARSWRMRRAEKMRETSNFHAAITDNEDA